MRRPNPYVDAREERAAILNALVLVEYLDYTCARYKWGDALDKARDLLTRRLTVLSQVWNDTPNRDL